MPLQTASSRFDDANTFASAVKSDVSPPMSQLLSDYLHRNDLGNAGATVAFTATINSVNHTFIYEQVGTLTQTVPMIFW